MRIGILRGILAAGVVATALGSGVAVAERHDGGGGGDHDGDHRGDSGSARSIPEFDPAAVGVIAALAAGGGVLLARRRKER